MAAFEVATEDMTDPADPPLRRWLKSAAIRALSWQKASVPDADRQLKERHSRSSP
jgi:hypothetical protein